MSQNIVDLPYVLFCKSMDVFDKASKKAKEVGFMYDATHTGEVGIIGRLDATIHVVRERIKAETELLSALEEVKRTHGALPA